MTGESRRSCWAQRPLDRRVVGGRVAELALAVERAALAADPRVAAVEQAVYADSAERVAIASSTGIAGEYERRAATPTCRRSPRARTVARPASASTSRRGPAALDPAAIGREGAERATAMIGAAQARVAHLPGRPRPDRRRQLRRPDRRRARRRRGAARPLAVRRAARRRRSPARPSSSTTTASTPRARPPRPSTARACPARRTALIEGGSAAHLPLRHLHGPPRRRSTRPATPGAPATARSRSVSTSNLVVAPGTLGFEELLRRGGRGRLRHRRRRPALRRQPGHRRLLGRRLGAGDPRRRAGRAAARVHDRQRPGLDAAGGAGGRRGGALGPLRRLGQHAAAADRRDDGRRILSRGRPSAALRRAHC